MAVSLLNFTQQIYWRFGTNKSNFIIPAKLQLEYSTTKFKITSNCFYNLNPTSLSESFLPKVPIEEIDDEGNNHRNVKLVYNLKKWVDFIRSVIPGGNWWNIEDQDVTGKMIAAKPITVLHVLRRMWVLLADDRWVVYIAFGSLTIAALSEISMPNLLATSIFSAQYGETLVFYRKLHLLILLCFASGICSGLRSGCFGVANMVLLKRLRETLYTALIFQGIGALINLLTLSWPLALSTCAICSVLSAIFLVYGQYQKKAATVIQDLTACANEVSQETLSLVRIVRVYGTETKEHGRYKQWLDKLALISMRESAAYGLWNMSFSTLYRLTQVFAIILGGMSILTGQASAEQLTKYVLYCEWLIYAAWRVADNFSSLLQSVGASEKVFQLMDLMPSDQFSSKGVKLQSLTGHFEFVNVSFHYPSRLAIATLEHVNFSVQANEAVAIVGLSGSGKSTLVYLLLGLYEPTHGQILIDDLPLRDLDIRWLRDNIGYVGQEPHLFRMDIKSNISYGCSRHIKQEDVEWAAKQAYAHEFISSLPNGYETIVDDELLSGGQKQRIAIARAILRDPAILIFDEATSALDAESEYYIQGLLHTLKNDVKAKRSIIFIAHRLSTAKAADKIVVMDGGRVVEIGDHGELIRRNGLYARLNRIQTDALA